MAHSYQQVDQRWKELWKKVENFDEESFTRKPSADEWSASEVIEHLLLSESGVLKIVKASLEKDKQPKAGILDGFKRLMVNFILDSKIKVSAPVEAVMPKSNKSKAERDAEWRETTERWSSFLNSFPVERSMQNVFKHPRAGQLNIEQTLEFMQKHVRHHIHQLDRIAEELQE